jgi:hypothetical protein
MIALGFFMSYTSGKAFALPTNSQLNNAPTSSSPFHDCMGSKNASWAGCRTAAGLTAPLTGAKPMLSRGLETRGQLPFNFNGIFSDLGQQLGGSEQCYSVNSLGGTGWLTTTTVARAKTEACTAAVNKAITTGQGYFNKPYQGYYQGNFGPVLTSKVGLYLSVILTGAELAGLDLDITQLAMDLCEKGIDHLTGDKGCTAPRKAGIIVEHTSVNGGVFDWALDGQTPQFDNTGVNCENCVMSMVMEASSYVDKDGKTAVPEDTPPS